VTARSGGGTDDVKIGACFQSCAIQRTVMNENKGIKYDMCII